MWSVSLLKKIKLKNPILIEGLPGVGNVAKITVDYLANHFKAKPLAYFASHSLQSAVFVREDNTVSVPTIAMYYARQKRGPSLLFLVGDVQPFDEASAVSFCHQVIGLCKSLGVKEVVTLGGLGTKTPAKKPQVYCTGTEKATIEKYAKKGVSRDLYGVVGPIVGVSGILLGLAKRQNIPSAILLVETNVGLASDVDGAKQLLGMLTHALRMKIPIQDLNEEPAMQIGLNQDAANYIG